MNRKRSKLIQMVVVAVVMIGLLIAAWPGVAQNEETTLDAQRISDLKARILAGDLPPMINGGDTTCNTSPSRPDYIVPGEMDWTMAVYQTYCNGYWDIFAIDRDSVESNRWLTNDLDPDIEPNLNYTANRVVFSRRVKIWPETYWWRIFAINVDRTGLTQLTAGSGDYRGPVWSLDGGRISYAYRANSNSHWNIYVMNAYGASRTQLTHDMLDNTQPTWSPDGSKIAWIKGGTTGAIWIMNADGSNQHPIATNLVYAENLRWSPDNTQLALDYDSDGDGMNELAIINADGTALHTVFDLNRSMEELWLSGWSPDGQSLILTPISYISSGGQTYIAYDSVHRVTVAGAAWSSFERVHCHNSLYVDWKPLERDLPVSQVEALSTWSPTNFAVNWSGHDVGLSGIANFDVQVKDGATGNWANWQVGAVSSTETYTGSTGHTYFFRSRAHDNAFNTEAYPSSPDAMTTIYQHAASGQMLDNREQPVSVANVQADPSALNTGVSRHDGTYDLYFASGGLYTLTTTRSNFSQLPPLLNVTVPSSNSLPTLYLPPIDNVISDSHFESGALSAWNPIGDLTPTITSTAHTGSYAALLGGSVPTDTVTSGPWHSTIEQTISVTDTIVSGTLSLLYRVESAKPLSDTLTAYVVGASNALTFTLPVTASEWTHAWFDVSTWIEPTATIKLDFAVGDVGRETKIILDEVTWGSTIKGSYSTFLPLIRR
jgi:Tol biopolymer transport system component